MTTSITPAPNGHDRPAVPARTGSDDLYDVATVLSLLLGGFLVPLVGWLAGVVMLWASPRWSAAQKWVGTLVWPAIVVVPLVAFVAVAALVGDDGGAAAGAVTAGALGALGLLVVLPVVCVRLLRGRAGRPTAA